MLNERKLTPRYALKLLIVMALLLTMSLGLFAAAKYHLLSETIILLMLNVVSILSAVFFVYVIFSYFRRLGDFCGEETRVEDMPYLPNFFRGLGHWAGWIILVGAIMLTPYFM